MEASNRNRSLAMAAMFQAAALVKDIAWQGRFDQERIKPLISSLFAFEADDIETIYGGLSGLDRGLRLMVEQIEAQAAQVDAELSRYLICILHLQRKLMKNKDMIQDLREGIEQAKLQSESFGLSHENIVARLGETYQNTISQLGPRIIVQGNQVHLGNPHNAAMIRSLLLAGIRAAVLWQQAGGSRWRLLIGRKAMVDEARRLLDELAEPQPG